MFFEVIAAAEFLAARVARVRPDPGVDSLMTSQFFVSSEGFIASVALEGSFPGVCSDVRFQLTVVGELGDIAVRTLKFLRSLLL